MGKRFRRSDSRRALRARQSRLFVHLSICPNPCASGESRNHSVRVSRFLELPSTECTATICSEKSRLISVDRLTFRYFLACPPGCERPQSSQWIVVRCYTEQENELGSSRYIGPTEPVSDG